jgi:monofunctional biosynthetic peptidoglycan transglycosylase
MALVLLLGPALLILVLRFVPPLVTPLMLVRLAEGYGLERRWVPLDEISPHLRDAVVASEDNLFCEHWGFDTAALEGQIRAAMEGERPRGASTITQQTAKNVFLWPGRDPVRKLLEAWLTPQLELLWGKRRIIEVYLNVVELGPGIYGAEAAARHWFRKPAAALSLGEAARLAAILPDPLDWKPTSAAIGRRAAVLERRIGQLGRMLACVR